MILSDFHVHTTYCDGKDSPEDIVQAAIALGMKKLGFSGHSYTPFDEEPCMSQQNTRLYVQEIRRLKEKYRSQITILCGTECDYYSQIDTSDYDYVIGSVHYIESNGNFLHVDHTPDMLRQAIDTAFDTEPYALVERYYSLVADVQAKTHADVIGHFDLVAKFNAHSSFFDESSPRYVEPAFAALDTLLKSGKPFEINTGAVSRGYRPFAYPSLQFLKYIAQRKGTVILSSDSHSKNTLMFQFREYEALAESLGLRVIEL